MDFVFFLLMLSPLILVHELGHFLAAKFFGVKVLTYGFGIGPKILKFRARETEYCLGLLPLGGYVRLLERGKHEMGPGDAARTFEALGFFKRVIIILAGPAMNLLFAILLYFSVLVQTTSFLAPTVGAVLPGYPADGQLLPGDRVMAIDDRDVGTFEEVRQIVADHPGESVSGCFATTSTARWTSCRWSAFAAWPSTSKRRSARSGFTPRLRRR